MDNLVARNEEYVSRFEEEVERTRELQSENFELRRSLELKDVELIRLKSGTQELENVQGVSSFGKLMKGKAQQTSNISSQFQCFKVQGKVGAVEQEMEILRNQLEYVSHQLALFGHAEGGQRVTPFLSDTVKNKGLTAEQGTEEVLVMALNLADKLEGFAAYSIVSGLTKRSNERSDVVAKSEVTTSTIMTKPVIFSDIPG
ncbi:hypothetical protein GE061_000255 [Apolygus lucorum]|uniref:Uncharacterized protein n=1 Tax=Apolygus lucorum TaxID=248454 RepID=A0A8S9Y3R7_APOLU|nr:hypothetical protein GE061_000255 [Apolygus lucorum]